MNATVTFSHASTSPASSVADSPDSMVSALRLAEERACAGYLAARKSMVKAGTRAISLGLMARQHPGRADYRAAWLDALSAHSAALTRTETAHGRWIAAQCRTDAAWTDTTGRANRAA